MHLTNIERLEIAIDYLSVRFAMMAMMTGLISHELVKESGQRMGERGVVPLHCACAGGDMAIVELLLRHHAQPGL